MRVGLYFDLRNPGRWRRDPTELYGAFLELCEEAEHLGIDSVRVTEHHGFDDDYLPAPLTLLAAAAARTRRIRLGTGIVVAPLHPADPEKLRSRRPLSHTSTDYFLHGTPAEMAAFVEEYTDDAPVNTVYLWAGLPGMGADMIARHVRTIAEDLVPLLADKPDTPDTADGTIG